jgi:uncharacterized protein (TIGR02147 family)
MLPSVFSFSSYKDFVNAWIQAQPKGGRGQLGKLAKSLRIHAVVMSQVFRGSRDLTLEQAVGVADFLGLSEGERDYFWLLVNHSRAGTRELQAMIGRQLEALRRESQFLKARIKHKEMSESEKSTFYSHWYYSGIRLSASIDKLNTTEAIADFLDLDPRLVTRVLQFLRDNRLLVETGGKMQLGPQVTHVGHDSPYVSRHQTNWRLQGLKSLERGREGDLFYSGPMVLSEQDAAAIREELLTLIERTTRRAARSPSEVLRCLNLDWFGP